METLIQPTEFATGTENGAARADRKLVDLGAVTEETKAQTKVVITVTDGVIDYGGQPLADYRR